MGIGNRANGSHHARADYKRSRVRREPRAIGSATDKLPSKHPNTGMGLAISGRTTRSCGDGAAILVRLDWSLCSRRAIRTRDISFDHLVGEQLGQALFASRQLGRGGDKVISPPPVALVEGRRRGQWCLPGTTDSLCAREAKVLHQVNQVVAQSEIRWHPVDRFYARHFDLSTPAGLSVYKTLVCWAISRISPLMGHFD